MIAPTVAIADRPHRVTFEVPGDPVPDGDGGYEQGWIALVPPTLSVKVEPATAQILERLAGAGTVLATATHIISGPFHPGITTKARAWFKGREFHVNGIANLKELGVDMVLVCTEIVK